ncbi:cell division protein FtsW [Helicobacter sp. 11S02629-2]|nr:cell division protein FtsW [Helicobacter sp. 11S02629-2]
MADKRLFIYVTLLLSVGILMSYSLSAYAIVFYNYSQFHFLARELITGIIGIIIMWGLSYLDLNRQFFIVGFIILVVSALLIFILPFLPDSIASSAGGAKRWIRLPGFSLNPIEPFKVGYIFFISWSLSRKFDYNNKYNLLDQIMILIPHIFVFAVMAFMIAVFQNDLGQVVLLGASFIIILIFAGGSFQLFGIIILGFGAIGSILIATSAHRILRLKTWWANIQDLALAIVPNSFVKDLQVNNLPEPYQIHNAANAIYNGGFFGTGLGNGTFKLGFLSDVHTDMVLAGISEELGFIGLAICVALIFFIVYRILRISYRQRNRFYYLFCLGISLLIAISFIINAFGIVGITPVKGIAVPFLSYGGSNLLSNCIAIGLVLALSKKVKLK